MDMTGNPVRLSRSPDSETLGTGQNLRCTGMSTPMSGIGSSAAPPPLLPPWQPAPPFPLPAITVAAGHALGSHQGRPGRPARHVPEDPAATREAAPTLAIGDAVEGVEPIYGGEAIITHIYDLAPHGDGSLLVHCVKKAFKEQRQGWHSGAPPASRTRGGSRGAGVIAKLEYEVDWLRQMHLDGIAPQVLSVHPSEHYFTMEYIHGCELTRFLNMAATYRGPGRLPQAVAVCLSLIDALRALARRGLEHKDMHPGNVLVRDDAWAVVLIDPSGNEWVGDIEQLRRVCVRALPLLRQKLRGSPNLDQVERLVRTQLHKSDARLLEAKSPATFMRLWSTEVDVLPTHQTHEPAKHSIERGVSRAVVGPSSETDSGKKRRRTQDNKDGDGPEVLASPPPRAVQPPSSPRAAPASAGRLQPITPAQTPRVTQHAS